jgi:hypothetical protein
VGLEPTWTITVLYSTTYKIAPILPLACYKLIIARMFQVMNTSEINKLNTAGTIVESSSFALTAIVTRDRNRFNTKNTRVPIRNDKTIAFLSL